MPKKTTTVATIGYEGAAMPGFLAPLREAGVGLLVDLGALATDEARDGMETLVDLAGGARKLCLLCFEADPAHCHRTLVAAALAERVPVRVEHLRPHDVEPGVEERD